MVSMRFHGVLLAAAAGRPAAAVAVDGKAASLAGVRWGFLVCRLKRPLEKILTPRWTGFGRPDGKRGEDGRGAREGPLRRAGPGERAVGAGETRGRVELEAGRLRVLGVGIDAVDRAAALERMSARLDEPPGADSFTW